MRIAVCDDCQHDAERLVRMILQFSPSFTVDVFYSADELLATYQESHRYDLIFMDIIMPGTDGFTAAQILKTLYACPYPPHRPLVVFATISQDQSVYGYGVAHRYLLKPLEDGKVREALESASVELSPISIIVQQGTEKRVLHSSDIVCAEIKDAILHIFILRKDVIQVRMTMDDFVSQLPDHLFVQPHKSFVVSVPLVHKYNGKLITMATGKEIPLSRNSRKLFDARVQAYSRGDFR